LDRKNTQKKRKHESKGEELAMASEDGEKREELDPFIQDEEREDGLACLHLPPSLPPSLARSWFM